MSKRKGLISILTVLLVFSLSLNVLGAGSLIDINAQMDNGIKIMVDGKQYQPKDPQDGSNYVPIIYKGRIYLPLRPVAEDIGGYKVTWDGNTRTAFLGDSAGEIAINEIKYTNAGPEFTSGGHLYYLKSRTPDVLNLPTGKVFVFGYTFHDPDYYAGYDLRINTNFEYHKFKASIWVDEVKLEDGTYYDTPELEFRDENDVLIKSIEVEWGKMYEVELDILDVKELNIWVRGSKSIIGEPKIGKP